MKKVVLTLVLGLLFVAFTNAQNTEAVKEDVKVEVASNDVVYKCPMKCEDDKTYKKSGQCPVCKMDLKAKKSSCKGKEKAECKGKKDKPSCKEKGKDKAECKGKKDKSSCKEKGKDKAECKGKKEKDKI